ncbi:hypothetical protein OSB04_000334 [Centaurea solstitialis]|uniref:Glycosyl transferase, family 14 n=1 Tax=Centaurea solstitialis TaxID=347529 RepID=A0AA38U8B2_9ASTR|nr:hypothetical protein OSB04_000334 [Centaurea solstitialis]
MTLHRTKHALSFFKPFHSQNSLFHLFIFLISLSIGFVVALYLRDFSTTIQASVFSAFPSLVSSTPSLSLPPHENIILPILASSSEPPRPPRPLLSESIPPQTLSPLLPPIAPLPSLPNGDIVSLSPSSQPVSSPPQQPLQATLSPQPISLQPPPPPPIESAMVVSMKEQIPMMHNESDEDLVRRVMNTLAMNTTIAPYKVAFMFLTPGPMPLLPLWELFFKGHKGLFSIYIHPHPDYNDTVPQDSVFYDTRIRSQLPNVTSGWVLLPIRVGSLNTTNPEESVVVFLLVADEPDALLRPLAYPQRKPVYWGDISMVDAERRLLANALLDPLNQRFVLLSDSCIPLFNFTTTYNYLVNSKQSYISSFDDKRKSGRGRYNPQMSPNITIQDWRKGSQWFEVNRDLAFKIVVEQKYYSSFKEFCHPPCYNDEHYLPTMVNILYGEMNSNRTVTHVDWSIVGPHPRKFVQREITEELLNSIRFGSMECVYNNNTTPMCLLFARKFAPDTLNPLLTFAPLLFGFNP